MWAGSPGSALAVPVKALTGRPGTSSKGSAYASCGARAVTRSSNMSEEPIALSTAIQYVVAARTVTATWASRTLNVQVGSCSSSLVVISVSALTASPV